MTTFKQHQAASPREDILGGAPVLKRALPISCRSLTTTREEGILPPYNSDIMGRASMQQRALQISCQNPRPTEKNHCHCPDKTIHALAHRL